MLEQTEVERLVKAIKERKEKEEKDDEVETEMD